MKKEKFPKSYKHLVFYDGECGLCDHVVQALLKFDKKQVFQFAPLQGKTASEMLRELPADVKNSDSLILIENYFSQEKRIYIYGEGALRIAWLLGGFWKIPGVISFLPPFLYNWAYRLVARNRTRFFKNASCFLPDNSQKERFLP